MWSVFFLSSWVLSPRRVGNVTMIKERQRLKKVQRSASTDFLSKLMFWPVMLRWLFTWAIDNWLRADVWQNRVWFERQEPWNCCKGPMCFCWWWLLLSCFWFSRINVDQIQVFVGAGQLESIKSELKCSKNDSKTILAWFGCISVCFGNTTDTNCRVASCFVFLFLLCQHTRGKILI